MTFAFILLSPHKVCWHRVDLSALSNLTLNGRVADLFRIIKPFYGGSFGSSGRFEDL